jgi:hypothetical protein
MNFLKQSMLVAVGCIHLAAMAKGQDLDCSSGLNARYFEQGFGVQRKVVSYLWSENFKKDCNRLDDFISAVSFSGDLGQPESGTLRCRNRGFSEGLHAALEDIQNDCTSECLENGQAIGTLTATQACAYGINAQQRTISVCGMNAQMACRTAIDSYIYTHCPDKAPLIEFLNAACEF